MLKGLTILTVLLTVTQATMPATGKTANHPASAGDSSQHNSNADKKPPTQSLSVGQSSQPTREQYDGSTEASKDNPQPVTIRELPSVSITKDWTDKSYWLFSGLLVIIGGLQVYLLWRTWERISAQEKRMAEQVKEMKDAREISNKTLILQYRPKIIVRHAKVLSFSDEIAEGMISKPVQCRMTFQIVNTGGSPAHVVDADIYLCSARPEDLGEEIEFKESTHIGIGQRTLQPGEWETIEFGLDTGIPNNARWVEIYKGTSLHRIFLLGKIWYRDDLDIPRQTGLHRSYDPRTKLFTPQKDSEEEYSD